MPTIVIRYSEKIRDASSETDMSNLLGSEMFDGIDEALLPQQPVDGKPIFITKKFTGLEFYRWQVLDVQKVKVESDETIYDVFLQRHSQLDKKEYLSNILKGKTIMSILQKYALVEVEFGHALRVGKHNGDIRSNKRYPESVQSGNMPKRRLAIVLRTSQKGSGAVVQVVPISSVQPHQADKTAIEVTDSLANMAHYQKRSWAICSMIETVPATRIIAPMVIWGRGRQGRDTGFKSKLAASEREAFETTLMHGLDRSQRVKEREQLAEFKLFNDNLKESILNLEKRISDMQKTISDLETKSEYAEIHESMARYLADCFNEKDFQSFRSDYSKSSEVA